MQRCASENQQHICRTSPPFWENTSEELLLHVTTILKDLNYETSLFTVVKRNFFAIKHIDNNNNSNNNNDNNKNYNNNNNSSNDVIIKSIKNAKSKYFLLLPDLSRKRMGLFKREKKIVFYFLIKIKIKAANQCFLIA